MATADHTTFAQAQISCAQRIKRQPQKFYVRMGSEPTHSRPHRPDGMMMAGAVLCALAYLLGLVIGTQL